MKQYRSLQKFFALLTVLVLVGIDQITKLLVASMLKARESFALIPGIFELHYLENQSAAFGIDPISILHRIFHFSYFQEHPDAFLKCKMIFFIILTLVVVAFLIWFYLRLPGDRHYFALRAALVLFVSGAIGNFIDRVWHNYVIDFFYFIPINFPIFNVADIYVTVAAFLLIILGIFYYDFGNEAKGKGNYDTRGI